MAIYFNKKLWTENGLFGENYKTTVFSSLVTTILLTFSALLFLNTKAEYLTLYILWWPMIDSARILVIMMLRLIWLGLLYFIKNTVIDGSYNLNLN